MHSMVNSKMRDTPHRWHARLALQVNNKGPRSIITRRQHQGPLVIQKPFYPEGNPCHIYLLHPPGGLVGGDQLELTVSVNPTAHCLITTPGASKFYRSTGPCASQAQHFTVAENGILEWLPQETILFNQCNANLHTQVNLQPQSRFIGWDILCLGRKASGEKFTNGIVQQKLDIRINEKPVLIERAQYVGGSELLSAAWGLANHTTVGTMVVSPADKNLLLKIREKLPAYADQHADQNNNQHDNQHEMFSATLIDNVLVCRYLGPQAQDAKKQFIQVWHIARQQLLTIQACEPRIWNT